MNKYPKPSNLIAYIAAIITLILSGAAIWQINHLPEPAGLSFSTPPPSCDVLDTSEIVRSEHFDECAQILPHFVERCADNTVPLLIVMTQESRWALRVGRPPTILPHDNDVRLVRSWCANGDA